MDTLRPTIRRARVATVGAAIGATLLLIPRPATAQFSDLPVGCEVSPTALAGPIAQVFVGSICFDLAAFIRPLEGGKAWSLNTGPLTIGGSRVEVAALFNADPFITFGLTTTNVSVAPLTIAAVFGTPVVPGFYSLASSSGGVSVTPGGSGSVTVDNSVVYPTYISGYGTLGAAATNLGVDLGTAPCTGTGLASTTCNQGVTTNSFAPNFYDNLEALLTYTQTDGGSVVSWSGRVDLTQAAVVPEPGTLVLVLTGLAAVGGVGALRRRRG